MTSRRALLALPALLPAAATAQTLARPVPPPPAAPAVAQDDTVAAGWRRAVVIRWGDRVTFDAPPFDPAGPDPQGAAAQFGWDARIAALVVPPGAADGVPRAVLAVAHTEVDPALAFPGGRDRPEVAAAWQGASLVNLVLEGGRWRSVDGGFQKRRLAADQLCRATGPLAAELGGALQGVLAVTGGAATPWGTLLLTEGDPSPWARRLPGFDGGRRFGWLVELDPLDPQSIPAKHGAAGRFPKADAAAALARDGRAVVFLAEQAPAGFLFRFLSAGPAGREALEQGALFAARREGGRLAWLPLPEAAHADPAEAARAAGATPFDSPAALHWDARGNRLLAVGGFGALAAGGEDPGGAGLALAELPAQGLGPLVSVAADARGRLWLGTGSGGAVGARAEAVWLLEGGRATAVYGAPRAADIGGLAVSPDGGTVFAGVRRPGAEAGASFERPGTRWPDFAAGVPPRSAVVALSRG